MNPDETRAAGLELAIAYCQHARVTLAVVLYLADSFSDYIRTGTWPKEAGDPPGPERRQDREMPVSPVGAEARQAGVRKPAGGPGEIECPMSVST